MKRLRYVRHSDKDGEFIDEFGLKRAMDLVPEDNTQRFTDVFHGPLVRTAQTLLAFVSQLTHAVKVHPIVPYIGDDDWLKQIATPDFKNATKSGMDNLSAAKKIHPISKLEEWSEYAAMGVRSMLDNMGDDNGFALAVGHDPVISWAAEYFMEESKESEPVITSLKTLGFIDFQQNDDDSISVTYVVP